MPNHPKEEEKPAVDLPTSELPRVAVIVLNWNLREDLAECLASLEEQTYRNVQVIVVDNASDDGSAEMVRAKFPGVHLIVNERNLGFAGGNNVGLRYALRQGAEYSLLLNNDTTVDAEMVARLVAVAEAEDSVGVLGPKILYYGSEHVWYLGHRMHRWLPVPRRVDPRLGEKPGSPAGFEVDYVSGCGMLIRREALEQTGLLDEKLFMHYEDADFCRRVRQAGFGIGCVPEARMWHKVSQSSQREAPVVRQAKARNRVLFYRKYRHGPHPVLTMAYVLASAGAIMARDLLRGDTGLIGPHARGLYEGFYERLPHGE
jgi:GT2 family glycosyltransferase